MRIMRRLVYVVVVGVVQLNVLGATQATRGGDASVQSLTLRLETGSRSFVPLEPIPIKLTLENASRDQIVGHIALDLAYGQIAIAVRDAVGREQLVEDVSTELKQSIGEPLSVNPGERLEWTGVWSIGLGHLVKPGVYALRARLIDPGIDSHLWSRPIKVVIRDPQGQDKNAYDAILASGRANDFLTRVSLERSDVQYLQEFVDAYGETPYADYAALVLGAAYASDADKAQRARDILSRLAAKKTFPRANDAVIYLSRLAK